MKVMKCRTDRSDMIRYDQIDQIEKPRLKFTVTGQTFDSIDWHVPFPILHTINGLRFDDPWRSPEGDCSEWSPYTTGESPVE